MGARVVTLAIRGPLERGDLAGLFERTCALLGEVGGGAADAVSVDALARLALAARRQGCRVQLLGACAELRALVAFVGLADVLREGPTPPAGAEARTAGRSARFRGRT
jgi:ABC-type transporter Mla MlaB component